MKQYSVDKKCIFVFVVQIFYSNRSFALVFLPLLAVGYHVMNQWMGYHSLEDGVGFGFWGTVKAPAELLMSSIALAFVLINAIFINVLFNRNEFMERNNFLASLLFVVLSSFFHSFYFVDGTSIAQMFLVFTLFQIMKLNQNQDGRKAVFNASFLFGVATTFYPILVLGVPFLFWMIWVLRPFVTRESFLSMVGFLVPLVYAGMYNYFFQTPFDGESFSTSSHYWYAVDTVVVSTGTLFLVFLGLNVLLGKLRVSSIRLKKLFRVIFLFGILSLVLFLIEFSFYEKLDGLSFTISPLMFVLPYAFGLKEQKAFPTFVFYVLFFFSIGKFFIPFNDLAL